MLAKNIEKEIEQFIVSQLKGVFSVRDDIGPDTELLKDLRIDGDDAYELLHSIEVRFNVELGDIQEDAFFKEANWFLSRKKPKPLTIYDLVRVVKEKIEASH